MTRKYYIQSKSIHTPSKNQTFYAYCPIHYVVGTFFGVALEVTDDPSRARLYTWPEVRKFFKRHGSDRYLLVPVEDGKIVPH